jgi:hypothetical protein
MEERKRIKSGSLVFIGRRLGLAGCLAKEGEIAGLWAKTVRGEFFFFFFYFRAISNLIQKHLKSFFRFDQSHSVHESICNQHECTTVLLNPMMNFNLIKNIIFLMFHEHQIS